MSGSSPGAFEFRHDSWFVDETYEVLRAHDAALVVADGGKVDVTTIHGKERSSILPMVSTGTPLPISSSADLKRT